MKQYIVFFYEHYYPRGGFEDYVGEFGSKQDVYDYLNGLHKAFKSRVRKGYATVQIVDQDNKTALELKNGFNIDEILDENKYVVIEKSTAFESFLEDCEDGCYDYDLEDNE